MMSFRQKVVLLRVMEAERDTVKKHSLDLLAWSFEIFDAKDFVVLRKKSGGILLVNQIYDWRATKPLDMKSWPNALQEEQNAFLTAEKEKRREALIVKAIEKEKAKGKDFEFDKSTVEEFYNKEYVVLRNADIISVYSVYGSYPSEEKVVNWPDIFLNEMEAIIIAK